MKKATASLFADVLELLTARGYRRVSNAEAWNHGLDIEDAVLMMPGKDNGWEPTLVLTISEDTGCLVFENIDVDDGVAGEPLMSEISSLADAERAVKEWTVTP